MVAATNRDLRDEVRQKRFREDLFYRLNVFHIALPSLRDRLDDLPLLVDHFVHKYAARHRKSVTGVATKSLAALRAHSWPGNVRELEHTVERAVIMAAGDTIEEFDIPESIRNDPEQHKSAPDAIPTNIADTLRAHEKAMVIAALQAEGGIQARAAKRLGVSRANLNYRIQKLGIVIKEIVYD